MSGFAQGDTVALDKRTPGIGTIDPLILPRLPELYARRAQRLRHLAAGHPAGDYLGFAATLVDAQARVLSTLPAQSLSHPPAQLAIARQTEATLAAADDWPALLEALLDTLARTQATPLPAQVQATAQALRALDRPAQAALALALLQERADAAHAHFAPFVWAALSLAWARRAQHPAAVLPGIEASDQPQCPVCGGRPVGSLILTGDRAGLRYLQCALCETRWHMVRAKCSNCDSAAQLEYLSFETPGDIPSGAATKAESCGDCHGFLKAFYQERDREVEVAADDLATLELDAAVEAEGFHRTGMNPFAFAA